jgi:rare lipoprotein A
MKFEKSSLFASGIGRTLILSAACLALASCAANTPKVTHVKKAKSTEYFAESLVGVKASPRVVNVALASVPGSKMKRLPRGGGRDMVGKPYKVRGRWYHPREDVNYFASGTASWYGDAFHGRLTANGEIYDMNNLTAAHTTMPLPSYARVTNIKNGKSVIVRVNDRGPYASDRLVDLSKRAAQLLDYTHSGTAQVRLEYIGRAPVHGQDDEYLLASYSEGGSKVLIEPAGGVMVAMNDGVEAEAPAVASVAFAPTTTPQPAATTFIQAPADAIEGVALEDTGIRGALPANAPVLINRPDACVSIEPCESDANLSLLNGYAPKASGVGKARAFDALEITKNTSNAWKSAPAQERILLGSYTLSKGKLLERQLRDLAHVSFEATGGARVEVYGQPVNGMSMDNLLRTLWRKGFDNAFIIRQ